MSSSATVRVEKATSDLLMGPDWTMNMDICDSINSHHWQAKDVVKAVKKRLQNKNPRVQLLSLTLLETMIKNCGDYVHFQIAERNILQEMIKIVRKKADMQLREKILVLLDSWQEAFGGPGGKYPQYYWAYEELRRTGVEFPQRTRDAAPIFTPPVTSSMLRHTQPGFGMPSNTSIRLDEAMASEMEALSLSNLDSMRSVMELLADMLQAVNPNDRESVKDEVIVDLVNRCRANQKKLMQMLNSTGDDELLGQGLTLNDNLQNLLAKHDAIASGLPLPIETKDSVSSPTEVGDSSARPTDEGEANLKSNAAPTTSIAVVTSNQLEEEEEEDDDFAQLARRNTKNRTMSSGSTSTGIVEGAGFSSMTPESAAASTSNPSNALALPDPPSQVRTTTKEQDIIDLLSITLSTTSTSPHTPRTPPPASSQPMHQVPVSPTTQEYTYGPQPYPGNQGQIPFNNYVAPWAQSSSPSKSQFQPQPRPQPQQKLQQQLETQRQMQPQYPRSSLNYPPPPWATNPTNSNQSPISSATPYPFHPTGATAPVSHMPVHSVRTLQNYNSFPARGNNGSITYGEPQVNSVHRPASPLAGQQKPFIPSYRLFEDLNVLGKADGGLKATSSSTSTGFQGMSGQSMVGGRK